jgi:hypothetical protein
MTPRLAPLAMALPDGAPVAVVEDAPVGAALGARRPVTRESGDPAEPTTGSVERGAEIPRGRVAAVALPTPSAS